MGRDGTQGEKPALAVCSFPELEQDSRLLFVLFSLKYLGLKFRPKSSHPCEGAMSLSDSQHH